MTPRDELDSRIIRDAHVTAAEGLECLEDREVFLLHQALCNGLDVFRELLLRKGLAEGHVDAIMHNIVSTVSFQERADVE